MDSLPEDIQPNIYKDVHGMAYSSVFNGIHKVGHKKEYTKVLKEVLYKQNHKLLEYGMPRNIDEDTIQGRIDIRMRYMLMEINDYMDMYEVHGDYDPDNELKEQINEIQSYDFYDISFEDAVDNALGEIYQQQAEAETESEPESEPERTPERARNTFRRYVPSAAEIYMEEMAYQREVEEAHRMYTNIGI